MITDAENVARAIFSPRMIIDGELQPAAFRLRASLNEDYLSVMRMAVSSWLNDIMLIPQREDRQLYGYAEMNVGEIRSIRLVFNGNNLTLFCAKKRKRNGKNNKEMVKEDIHTGVQDGSSELPLHAR